MKVQICETVSVDVETTVDVDLNEVLMEFSRRMETCEMNEELPPYKSLALPLVDFATNMIARIPSVAIAKYKDSQRAEVVRRLVAELERWNGIIVMVD
jgi:hypothetical protein